MTYHVQPISCLDSTSSSVIFLFTGFVPATYAECKQPSQASYEVRLHIKTLKQNICIIFVQLVQLWTPNETRRHLSSSSFSSSAATSFQLLSVRGRPQETSCVHPAEAASPAQLCRDHIYTICTWVW